VSDSVDDRLLLFRPATGETFPFSPRIGSGTNHLDRPQGIVVDPAGPVWVASEQTGKLVRIDPETGVQSVVHGRNTSGDDLGELTFGQYVRGLEMRKTAGLIDATDLYVVGDGTLWLVARGILNSISASLVSDHSEFDTNYSYLALLEVEGGNELTDVLVAGYGGVTRYQVGIDSAYRSIFSGDVRSAAAFGSRVFIAEADPCGPSPFPQSGIWEAVPPTGNQLEPISIAGLIDCPVDLDVYSEAEIYVLQHVDFDIRSLVRLDLSGDTWTQTYLGELGDSTAQDTFQMAVVPENYVPEPAATPLGVGSGLALGALARRKR
jgi:hypothetical protein